MKVPKATSATLCLLVSLLTACDRERSEDSFLSASPGCVDFSSPQVLDFELAPVIPSPGGILAHRASDDRFAFVDRNLRYEILVFDASGGFEESLGREGNGPGEYQRITGMAFDSSDSLWVLSRMGRRVDLYGPDLEWARSMTLEKRVRRFAPLRDGFFIAVIASGPDTEIEILDREGGFRSTGIVVPPVPPGALIPSMAELTQVATDRADRFWVFRPYSHQLWEGHLGGGSRLLLRETPSWFVEDYSDDVKSALEGMIDPGGSTVLALQYDSGLDALWVFTGLPESSLGASDLEEAENLADLPPLLVDHVVEALGMVGGEVLCTQRFDFLDISLDGAGQYRIREDGRLEVLRPRIR